MHYLKITEVEILLSSVFLCYGSILASFRIYACLISFFQIKCHKSHFSPKVDDFDSLEDPVTNHSLDLFGVLILPTRVSLNSLVFC